MSIWSKLFSNFQWQNRPSTATPLGKINLQKLNDAIDGIDDRVVSLKDDKAETTDVTTALVGKVDVEEGKGLSTEDYTTAEKTKLEGISAQANKVEITPVVTEGTTLATISIDGVVTAIKGSDIDVDSTLSLVSNNPVENKTITSTLNNLMENKIAEGNPITIHNASGLSAKSCEVTFPLIQAGSGDPSPENVRPITVWNEVNVYCDTEQTLTPAKTITADLDGSYFSGKVVWNSDGSCKAIIDTKYNLYVGEEGWSQKGALNDDNRFNIGITNLKQDSASASICNYLKYESGSSGNWGTFRVTGSFFVVKDNGDNFTTLNAFKEYLSEHPLQLCYPLSTPIEINLSASEIELLSGTNCLWTDGDNIRLVYSTNKADDELSSTSENPVQNKVITSALNEKANSVSIAPLYDSTKTYTYDDYVMYNGRLYKCNAFATTGTFDPTKWVTAELINIVAMRDRIEMSLEEIREIVQSGLAHEVFNIGDQIVVQWKDNATNVTYDCPLDVVHFEDVTILNDNDEEVNVPAMIVQWHYCSPFGVQFDASEAFYVVSSGGMSAGDYYFNVPTALGSMTAGNYQFTVDSTLSEGTQLTLSVAGGTSTSLVGAKVYAYASPTSTTKIGEYTISSGNSGTNLGQLKNAGDTNINGFQRVIYGYNRWSQSALKQFLNSSEINGNWWTAQNKYDRLPNELATKHGFMSGFSEEFLGIIKPIKINTAKNTVTDDGTIESTFDTFFVPALEQEHINPQIAGEGSVWEYWFRKSQSTTPLAQGGTYPQMRTFAIENHSSAQTVRLRSAYRSGSFSAWVVFSSGYVGYYGSVVSSRFAPACAIC